MRSEYLGSGEETAEFEVLEPELVEDLFEFVNRYGVDLEELISRYGEAIIFNAL